MTLALRAPDLPSAQPSPASLSRIGKLITALAAPVTALNAILPHIGPVSAYSAYAALMFVYGILHMRRRPPSSLRRTVLLLCIPLLAVALSATVFNFSDPRAFAESVVVSGGLMITLGFIALPSTRETARAILTGWLIASLATSILAVIELTTGRHFGATYLDANPGASKTGVVTVFYNPNNYAAFLTLTIPLLIAGAALAVRPWIRRIYYVAALISAPVMIATSSRFGVAALVLGSAVWLVLKIRSHLAQAFVLVFALIGVALAFRFLQDRSAGEISGVNANADEAIRIFGLSVTSDPSLVARWNLMLNGFDMISASPFGAGPSGYEKIAQAQGTSRMTFGMINPHNGAVEFIVQYGVIFGILAVIVTIALFASALRVNSVLPKGAPERAFAAATACLIAVLPLIFSMHSTFVNVPHEWVGFATITSIGIALLRAQPALAADSPSPDV